MYTQTILIIFMDLARSNNSGKWSEEEHNTFVQALQVAGRDWKRVALLVPSRTEIQIRSHAQKYFNRITRKFEEAYSATQDRASGNLGCRTRRTRSRGEVEMADTEDN